MSRRTDELFLRDQVFPGANLLESYYHRDLTRLSDRGLASNMIGDRWSALCAEEIATWQGQSITLPDGANLVVDIVYRLDDIPRIATIASRRKLQNPDFILEGRIGDELVLMAIDAKFSIDTAKTQQVSAETLQALLDVGEPIVSLLPGLPSGTRVRDGIFLSPEAPLTQYVMQRRKGRLSVSVSPQEIMLLPVAPVPFLKDLEGARLLATLAAKDEYRAEIRTNMLLAMYYFRLARACYGAYADVTAPVFGPPSAGQGTEADMEQRTIGLARGHQSAWETVLAWDALADQARNQREVVYGAMPFPIPNRDLRDRVVSETELRGGEQPSINSVRRRVGSWYRNQFEERIGIVLPPVDDLTALIQQVHRIAADVAPQVPDALDRAIDEAFAAVAEP